jgi:hypothetical protein
MPIAAIEREIRTATGDSETLLLTPMGEDLFRLEESSFVTDAVYRDVIRATEAEDGALLFVEIAERSPLVTNICILRQELIESEAIQSILKQIMEQGGNWEQVFGGVLIVHTSPTTAANNSRQQQPRRSKTKSVALRPRKCPKLYEGRLAPPPPFRLLSRRSGRIPALPYPPLRFSQCSSTVVRRQPFSCVHRPEPAITNSVLPFLLAGFEVSPEAAPKQNWLTRIRPQIGSMTGVSPGRSRMTRHRWSGIVSYPEEGFNRAKGEYETEISDSASGASLIQIKGEFHGVDPRQFQANSSWVTSRYFLFPLAPRRILFCDVDRAAAAKGVVVQEPPARGSRQTRREIMEETPHLSVSSIADTPVVDQTTGRILGLTITVFVHVKVADHYHLKVTLSADKNYEGAETEASLEVDNRTLSAVISSSELRKLRVNGPYSIAFVELSHAIPEGRGLDYHRFDVDRTQVYHLSDLAP